jgi:quercetin dioxygenase-like cupin family protein
MRILLTGLIALLISVTPVVAQQGQHMTMTNEALKWVEQGDPSKEGPFVYRVKLPANYKIAPHYHKAIENVTVLSGVFFIGMGEKFDQGSGKELPVGGFVSVPPTHRHFAWAGGEETLIQVHGVGPTDITFVNPADDPRKK